MAISKEQYAEQVKQLKARLDAGECGDCPCTKTKCHWHGHCRDCVRIHRIDGQHLPQCLQFIITDHVQALAAAVELQTTPTPPKPDDYYDHAHGPLAEE